MKLLFDYFPVICFFIAYKFFGVYAATAVTMGACALQNIVYWLIHKRFEKMHMTVFISVVVLGSFTLLFHNALFIQWKPTIIYWIFAIVLLSSHYLSAKNLMARMLDDKITLPEKVWANLNVAWAIFFVVLGIINIYVMYHYSLNSWVNFKLFGTLGLTLAFTIVQALYMARYIKSEQSS